MKKAILEHSNFCDAVDLLHLARHGLTPSSERDIRLGDAIHKLGAVTVDPGDSVESEPVPCGFTGTVRWMEDPYRHGGDTLDVLKSMLFNALIDRDDKAIGILGATLGLIIAKGPKGS